MFKCGWLNFVQLFMYLYSFITNVKCPCFFSSHSSWVSLRLVCQSIFASRKNMLLVQALEECKWEKAFTKSRSKFVWSRTSRHCAFHYCTAFDGEPNQREKYKCSVSDLNRIYSISFSSPQSMSWLLGLIFSFMYFSVYILAE